MRQMGGPSIPAEYVSGGFALGGLILGHLLAKQRSAEEHRRKIENDMLRIINEQTHYSHNQDELWEKVDALVNTVAGLEGIIRGLTMYPDLFRRKPE